MGCCPSMGPGLSNVSLSTATNYQSLRQSPLFAVRGTTVTLGVLVGNMTGTATLTVRLWVSYDGGSTLKSGGTAGTATTSGPFEVSFTNVTAPWAIIEASISGTTVWCICSVVPNFVSP